MKIKQNKPKNMLELIKIAIENVTNCDINNPTRKVQYIQARTLFYHFARKNKYTLQAIAEYVDKNHASVIHGLKKFEQDLEYDFVYRGHYRDVLELLGSIEVEDVVDTSKTLLESYELKNRVLMNENLRLTIENEKLTSDRVMGIDDMLAHLPKDRVEHFMNNHVKTYLLMENSVIESNAKREAQRELDKADKIAFRLAALDEDGTGRRGDARNFTYLSV